MFTTKNHFMRGYSVEGLGADGRLFDIKRQQIPLHCRMAQSIKDGHK
jgi:hypothetical protein